MAYILFYVKHACCKFGVKLCWRRTGFKRNSCVMFSPFLSDGDAGSRYFSMVLITVARRQHLYLYHTTGRDTFSAWEAF